MAGRNDEPNWRSAAGGPARKGKQHGWQQEDPQSNVRSGTRRFKMLFLIGGGLAAAVGIVYLIFLLMPGKRPGFLAIAADPREGIARLDVPYDPYGWLGAKRLLKWMNDSGADEHVPKVLAENPLWLDDQFDEWIEKVAADQNIDPVIVYIGLHGGVNADGDPILYTGRDAPSPVREADRPAVQLGKILKNLDEKAAKKRKVVLLDVGRGLPDANLGEISNDFARAVKAKLGATIAAMPTMTVVLAAGEDERAWDSPHLGTTALAYALLQSLSGTGTGSVGNANMSSYRADDLVESLQKNVAEWSKNNRPTTQTVQVLPPLEDWRADAGRKAKYAERMFFKPRDGGPKPGDYVQSGAQEASPVLKEEWDFASKAAARIPAPATYTPIAWRRYRELLSRYERAVLAGDTDGAGPLMNALKATRDDIERGLALKLDSVDYQLPLGAALGRPSSRSLDAVPNAPGLAEASKQALTAIGNAPARPVEAHLPIMLNRYAREILKTDADGPLASAWKTAVTTRILAERAALGARANPKEFPYSERVWPLVAAAVIAGDKARRRGEDKLHGEADQVAASAEAFRESDKFYREALVIADRIQGPLRVRDEAFADLPYLARWLVEADESGATSTEIDAGNKTMRELWTNAMELAKQIERAPAEPAALATAAEKVGQQLKVLQNLAAERAKTSAQSNAASNLQTIENLLLLPAPLIGNEERLRLIERSRGIENELATKNAEFKGGVATNPEKVVRRMHAIAQSLGGDWATWAATRPDIPKYETTLKMSDANPYAKTPALMAAFAAHRQRQADFAKHPEGGPVERAQAELFSRLAVPFAQFPNPEPATVNARRRWKALLEAQALRIALDHWYNEAGLPYFTGEIAPKYLADARRLAEKLGERDAAKSADETETLRLMALKPLGLKCLDADTAIRWTTESDRKLRYVLQPTPFGLPGEGVLSWVSDNSDLIALDFANRKLVDLDKPLEGGGPQVTLKAGSKIEEAATGVISTYVKASGYFRGQRQAMDHSAEVKINRRPDFVSTTVKPTRNSVVAVRSDRDFSPGAVSILLDYSASMTFEWDKNQSNVSKKEAMVKELEEILSVRGPLPVNTELKIHAFLAREKPDPDRKETEVMYDFERAAEKFQTDPTGPNGIITKLRNKAAYGNTPLLATMRETIDNMKRQFSGNKTLIVLTDGADTTFHEKLFGDFVSSDKLTPDMKKRLIEAVHAELPKFEDLGVTIQLLVFGQDENETELAEKMFRPITLFAKNPGRVYVAQNRESFRQELAAALRPKPRLLTLSGGAVRETTATETLVRIPTTGIPTDRTDRGLGVLRWRGPIPPDSYEFHYSQTRQGIAFAAGEAMCVKLLRDKDGVPRFDREIFYRDVEPPTDPALVDNTNGSWHLAVPEFGYASSGNYFFISTAALEDKRGTEGGAGSSLKQVRPTFAWWELTRAAAGGEQPFPGPVSVHNVQGQPAPSWRVVADNGSKSDGLDNSNFKLRVWPRLNDLPNFGERTVRTSAANLREGIVETIQDVTLRARLETIPFVKDSNLHDRLPAGYGNGAASCLVVRVEDPRGRRFQVQISQRVAPEVAEHRYFYDKDDKSVRPKIAAYTAVFGKLDFETLAPLGDLDIALVSISDVLESQEPQSKPLTATLNGPRSKPASQKPLEPTPIN